jgi:hypothetical protein
MLNTMTRTKADSSLVSFEDSIDEEQDSSMAGQMRACCLGVDFYIVGCTFSLTFLYLAGGITWYSWWEQWSYVDALYFSVVAGTTVGYGDLTPTDSTSRMFTVGYIFFGIAGAATAFGECLSRSPLAVPPTPHKLGPFSR